MKKTISLIMLVFTVSLMIGCGKNPIEKLEGNDLTAYEMMLEVCYNADDPSKVKVISGTVTDDIGLFKVSYEGEKTYNVSVSGEDGNYKAETLHEALVSESKELLYKTDDFSAKKVNKALKYKWSR